MFIKLFSQLLLLFLADISLGNAEQTYVEADIQTFGSAFPCVNAKAYDGNHPVYFIDYNFSDGSHDLAIAIEKPNADGVFEIKRVTFNGNQTTACDYNSLAIVLGGSWGWHLVWQKKDDNVLRYARMDGEAWVSSPTKKLTKNAKTAEALTILTLAQQVWVVWFETNNNMHDVYAAFSNDEGRTWQEARQLTQTTQDIRQLKLMIYEQQPYLIWDGEAKGVSLLAW